MTGIIVTATPVPASSSSPAENSFRNACAREKFRRSFRDPSVRLDTARIPTRKGLCCYYYYYSLRRMYISVYVVWAHHSSSGGIQMRSTRTHAHKSNNCFRATACAAPRTNSSVYACVGHRHWYRTTRVRFVDEPEFAKWLILIRSICIRFARRVIVCTRRVSVCTRHTSVRAPR